MIKIKSQKLDESDQLNRDKSQTLSNQKSQQIYLDNDQVLYQNINQENVPSFIRTREERHRLQSTFANQFEIEDSIPFEYSSQKPNTTSQQQSTPTQQRPPTLKSQFLSPQQLLSMQNLSSLLLKVEHYVMQGNVQRIQEIMEFWDPNFWTHSHNQELHYRLWKVQFIEKNEGNMADQALEIARTKLSLLAEGHPSLEKDVKECISQLMDNLLNMNMDILPNSSSNNHQSKGSSTLDDNEVSGNKDKQDDKTFDRVCHLQELSHDISQRLRNDLDMKIPTLQSFILILVDNFAQQSRTHNFEVPQEIQEAIGLSKLKQLIKQITQFQQQLSLLPQTSTQNFYSKTNTSKDCPPNVDAPVRNRVRSLFENSQESPSEPETSHQAQQSQDYVINQQYPRRRVRHSQTGPSGLVSDLDDSQQDDSINISDDFDYTSNDYNSIYNNRDDRNNGFSPTALRRGRRPPTPPQDYLRGDRVSRFSSIENEIQNLVREHRILRPAQLRYQEPAPYYNHVTSQGLIELHGVLSQFGQNTENGTQASNYTTANGGERRNQVHLLNMRERLLSPYNQTRHDVEDSLRITEELFRGLHSEPVTNTNNNVMVSNISNGSGRERRGESEEDSEQMDRLLM